MTTIRAFFLQIRALFSNFQKRAGEISPAPLPPLVFYFRVTNSKLKNKKLHFELLTRSWKTKSYTSINNSRVKLLLFCFRVTNWKLKKKIHFELLTRWLNFEVKIIKLRLKLLTGKLKKKDSLHFILYILYYTL